MSSGSSSSIEAHPVKARSFVFRCPESSVHQVKSPVKRRAFIFRSERMQQAAAHMQRCNVKLTILTIPPRGKVVSMVSCGQLFRDSESQSWILKN
jgi:hypothetical protein